MSQHREAFPDASALSLSSHVEAGAPVQPLPGNLCFTATAASTGQGWGKERDTRKLPDVRAASRKSAVWGEGSAPVKAWWHGWAGEELLSKEVKNPKQQVPGHQDGEEKSACRSLLQQASTPWPVKFWHPINAASFSSRETILKALKCIRAPSGLNHSGAKMNVRKEMI